MDLTATHWDRRLLPHGQRGNRRWRSGAWLWSWTNLSLSSLGFGFLKRRITGPTAQGLGWLEGMMLGVPRAVHLNSSS